MMPHTLPPCQLDKPMSIDAGETLLKGVYMLLASNLELKNRGQPV